LLRAAWADLQAVADQKKHRLDSQLFTRSDGLESAECAGGGQPAAARDAQGRLWFATAKGVARLDPARLRLNPVPPSVLIEELSYLPAGATSGDAVQSSAGGNDRSRVRLLPPFAQPVRLPPGSHNLQVRFLALSLLAPEKVRYRFHTDGPWGTWNDLGPRRTVYFDALAPGLHRFRVTACNNDGLWNPEGAALSFVLAPQFWQTWWFRWCVPPVAVGLAALIAWLFSRTRTRRLLERLEHRQRLAVLEKRLAAVLENTTDFVGFADGQRRALYINRAGRKLIGLAEDREVEGQSVEGLYPAWANERVVHEAVPTALREGIWQGESAFLHRDGHEIPVSQVIIAHRKPDGRLDFLSTIARDMSALKKAEERARHENVLRELVIAHAADGICVWHLIDAPPGMRFTIWNDQMTAITGHTMDQANQLGWCRILYRDPVLQEQIRRRLQRAAEGENLTEEERELTRPDGSRRLVLTSTRLLARGPSATHVLAIVRDVTDRRREETLREGLRRLAEQLTASLDLKSLGRAVALECRRVFHHDAFWLDVVEPNTGSRKAVYAEDTRPGGQNPEEVVATANGQWPACITDVLEGSPKLIVRRNESEAPELRPWGFTERLSQSLMFAPIRFEGRCVGLMSVQSYTAGRYTQTDLETCQFFADQCASAALRVQAQSAWEAERQFVTTVLDTAAALVVVTERTGRIVRLNQACECTIGYAPSDVVGRPFWEVFTLPEASEPCRQFFRGEFAPAFPQEHELTCLDKAGTRRVLRWTFSRLPGADSERQYLVATGLDLTERRRAEETQQQLEAQLRQAQKMEALGTLAGGIAHDFNNILAAILGHAELLRGDWPPEHPIQESLSRILTASYRGRDLVRQILTFSRRQERPRAVIHLHHAVDEALKLLRASLPATIQIQTHLDTASPPVLADMTQVHQVLMNLCANAWQAMEPYGGRLDLRLDRVDADAALLKAVPDLRVGTYVCLTVADTGRGMDRATLDRIYDPFFTTKAPGQGTGLGLAVVHGIVKAHEGAISVRSEVGQGTVFQVYFPAAGGPTVPEPGQLEEWPLVRGNAEHILLVDDEEAVANVATRILERQGYVVSAFTAPEQALEKFKAQPQQFDLVLTDLTMPGLSGLDLTRRLLTLRPTLPVVLVTGYGGAVSLEEVRQRGVRELLRKPFTPQALSEVIKRALTQPRIPSSEVNPTREQR
jgi:PAS domain S-box-containing protein